MALLAGVSSGFGFALEGPYESYQDQAKTYQVAGLDIGGPHNLGEEFRWNTPIINYAFDVSFLDYFGSNGVFAIEQGLVMYNSLTNFTHYSRELSEFPLEGRRINFRAQALRLRDLKSVAMRLIIEEFGLDEPDRWTWALRDRISVGLPCPFMQYHVIKRNFDPVTFEPSSYVNGTLYTYIIEEFCAGTPYLADAVEYPVDPLAPQFTALASNGVLQRGSYVTGFTRDDVGGLRYLYRTNNVNYEQVSDDSLLIVTNRNTSQLLVSSNLTLLVAQSLTNDAAALQVLYPELVITSTSNFFQNVRTTNVFAYFVNEPFQPYGTLAAVKIVTNYTTNVQARFSHSFGNVITNAFSTNGFITILETNITQAACGPFAPAGSLCTNITTRTVFVPGLITGDFFILPTNFCSFFVVATQLVTTVATTNLTVVATNSPGVTNVNGEEFSQSQVFYSTNRSLVINPVLCLTNSVALRQGMDRFKFVRQNFDSLIGRFFQPITNTYTLVAITNSQPVVQTFIRVVTRPDYLFRADDQNGAVAERTDTASNFRTNNAVPGLAGPGNIEPNMTISFNKVGPLLINLFNPSFLFDGLSESTAITNFVWGSYDGSTNAPIVYPQGTSITDLENQLLFGVATFVLPSGTVGFDYSASLQPFGGTPPIIWALAPGSPGLPPGLTLSSDGTISGVPTTAGIYDFTVRAMESGGRTADRAQEIIINP